MTAASPVTDNEMPLRMRVEERAAAKAMKGDLTYTQFFLAVKEGILPPVKLPASVYKAKYKRWCAPKIYPTAEQAAVLIADAERRGITVSKAIRADVFQPPKNLAPAVKAESLRLNHPVADPVRDDLDVVRKRPEFGYTALMTEGAALIEIAGVLLAREAKAHI